MKIIKPSFEILPEQENFIKQIERRGKICYKREGSITETSYIDFFNKIMCNGHGSVLEMAILYVRILGNKVNLIELYDTLTQNKYIRLSWIENGLLVSGSVRTFFELSMETSSSALKSFVTNNIKEVINEGIIFKYEDTEGFTYELLSSLHGFNPAITSKHKYVAVKFIINRAISHELVRHRPASFLQESQRYCRYAEDRFDNEVTFIESMFFEPNSKEYRIWEESMEKAEIDYFELLKTCSPQAARTVLPNSCKTEIIVYTSLDHWKLIFELRTSQAAEPSMREVMIPLQEEFKRLGYV